MFVHLRPTRVIYCKDTNENILKHRKSNSQIENQMALNAISQHKMRLLYAGCFLELLELVALRKEKVCFQNYQKGDNSKRKFDNCVYILYITSLFETVVSSDISIDMLTLYLKPGQVMEFRQNINILLALFCLDTPQLLSLLDGYYHSSTQCSPILSPFVLLLRSLLPRKSKWLLIKHKISPNALVRFRQALYLSNTWVISQYSSEWQLIKHKMSPNALPPSSTYTSKQRLIYRTLQNVSSCTCHQLLSTSPPTQPDLGAGI